jgi:hypothetical protein
MTQAPPRPAPVLPKASGKWIARAVDTLEVLAIAETPEALDEATARKGDQPFAYEWVPPAAVFVARIF